MQILQQYQVDMLQYSLLPEVGEEHSNSYLLRPRLKKIGKVPRSIINQKVFCFLIVIIVLFKAFYGNFPRMFCTPYDESQDNPWCIYGNTEHYIIGSWDLDPHNHHESMTSRGILIFWWIHSLTYIHACVHTPIIINIKSSSSSNDDYST